MSSCSYNIIAFKNKVLTLINSDEVQKQYNKLSLSKKMIFDDFEYTIKKLNNDPESLDDLDILIESLGGLDYLKSELNNFCSHNNSIGDLLDDYINIRDEY